MRKHGHLYVRALGAFFYLLYGLAVLAQSDPSTLPLIQFSDLVYSGTFRLPDPFMNGDGITLGGHPVTFNPGRNSLLIGSRIGNVAEMSIPTPVINPDITALPFATFLQGFYEPTEGGLSQVASSGASISGLLVYGSRMYGSASIYYDANNTQRVSHYSRSLTLSTSSFVGMRQVWDDEKSGFVSGYMATVPPEWQSRLGGPAVTGNCCLPIAWRTSWGPSAFAFNPAHVDTMGKVPATPLLYYPYDSPTLGRWDTSNPTYGGTTQITGVALLAGTRTALFFGRNGTGPFCYGNGTADQRLVGTTGPDGEVFCYDPAYASKGQHAYPYNYQIWAYDMNELAAVRAGTKQPWEVTPYGVWPFNLPYPEVQVRIGGIAYDSSRQIIYVVQMFADKDGYGYRPLVHALKVGGGAAGTPLPPADTTPLPATPTPPSTKATAVTVVANRTAPQAPGTTVTFTATPTGGPAPHQYKWLVYDGARWNIMTSWSTSNSYNWTPSIADPNYQVGVWVRSSGNHTDELETSSSIPFPISGAAVSSPTPSPSPSPTPSPSTRVTAVSISPDRASPQSPGTTINWTASAAGGAAPLSYKWLVYDGARWNVVSEWSTSNSYAWRPSIADPNFKVGVWVKSAGNAADAEEVSTSVAYPISGTASSTQASTASPSTIPGARVSSVSITANHSSPQPAGTTMTVTATPVGGTAPHQYKWMLYDGASWKAISEWAAANSFNWTPTYADPNFQIGVWVRSAGVTTDMLEASASMAFPITASGSSTAPPSSPSQSATVSAVIVLADRPSPQALGTTVNFVAGANGGIAPVQYKWLVYDGASWRPMTTWSTSVMFAWTAPRSDPNYRVGVWVRNATSTVDAPEASHSIAFPIQ